ncbi:MAG: hypothetical protein ACLU8D_01665 [Enterocloster sp.]
MEPDTYYIVGPEPLPGIMEVLGLKNTLIGVDRSRIRSWWPTIW